MIVAELGLLVVGFVAYFLPALIALSANRRDAVAITVLNFFAGWTFIGWIVAIVWACKQESRQ